MNTLQISRTDQIKEKIHEMGGHYKMTVSCGYDIGKLLTEQKEELEHGEFTKCLQDTRISNGSAHNYMKLYEYKITSVGNLSEAYKQIESLELKKQQKEFAENNKMIDQLNSTGEKPKEWTRQTDYQYKKQTEDTEYIKRKQAMFKKNQDDRNSKKAEYDIVDEAKKLFAGYETKIKELSHNSLGDKENDFLQSNIFTAIDLYISKFGTPSDKIQAGHNIIKHIKVSINDNQVKSSVIATDFKLSYTNTKGRGDR